MHSNTWLLRQTGKATYGDRLERAFHNAAPAAVSRSYTEHVYYQSANLQEIPMGINGNGYHEYGANISRRWHLDEMHTPPCCTGNQARLLPNYIHHSALRCIAIHSRCAHVVPASRDDGHHHLYVYLSHSICPLGAECMAGPLTLHAVWYTVDEQCGP